MQARSITKGLYEIDLGGVNAHLIDGDLTNGDGTLALIDTGSAGSDGKLKTALAELGYTFQDLTHILITHVHADHAGALSAIQAQTSARTFMHKQDAILAERGEALRPLKPAPGLMARLLFPLMIAPTPSRIAPVRVDACVEDGDVIPVGGGLHVVHAPGHCAGQIVLWWEAGSVLFAADTTLNIPTLSYHLAYEDFSLGKHTASHLAERNFDIACFGHGRAITKDAAQRFRRQFQ